MNPDLKACSFDSWYNLFENDTFPSRIIPLPSEFIAFLLSDGIRIPRDPVEDASKTSQKSHYSSHPAEHDSDVDSSEDSDWSDEEDEDESASDNIHRDLEKSPSPPILVLRAWKDINPSDEFRCFVGRRTLIGVSQRDTSHYIAHVAEQKEAIMSDISQFFNLKIRFKFPRSSYVFDVVRSEPGKVTLVSFDPFGSPTDGLMFDWGELIRSVASSLFDAASSSAGTDLSNLLVDPSHPPASSNRTGAGQEVASSLREEEEGGNVAPAPDFRYVTSPGIQPSSHQHAARVPLDFQHLSRGEDPQKFLDLMNLVFVLAWNFWIEATPLSAAAMVAWDSALFAGRWGHSEATGRFEELPPSCQESKRFKSSLVTSLGSSSLNVFRAFPSIHFCPLELPAGLLRTNLLLVAILTARQKKASDVFCVGWFPPHFRENNLQPSSNKEISHTSLMLLFMK
ncbi:unnamed protein product [Cyprideis torosa]|uniref:Cell division cycle protein 123 n=1 Tax=Cyprideis torosa TaxID=163714 RepID=A0A7R8W610_9CRUS|nr:unnamed protein product [Cyprideis torosa]CAG0884728.1 unnamed protein product [Cyprideis torosa]